MTISSGKKFIIYTVLATVFMLGISYSFYKAMAGPSHPASIFVQDMADEGFSFLSDKNLSDSERKERFGRLLENRFDIRTIGIFSTGRYWHTMTDTQKDDYIQSFKNSMVNVYAKRFKDYKGQRFRVEGAMPNGEKDFMVRSYITPDNNAEIKIDWRVRRKKDGFRIVDVIVQGVSMAITRRSDFSSVIQRHGGNADALIKYLQDDTGVN